MQSYIMESGKIEVSHFSQPQTWNTDVNVGLQQPPPYTQDPPAYDCITQPPVQLSGHHYFPQQPMPPQQPVPSQGYPQPPITSQGYPQPPITSQGYPQQPIISQGYPQPPIISQGYPQPPITSQNYPQQPMRIQHPGSPGHGLNHPVLNPGPTQTVHITSSNGRVTKSVVTDHETGKEYCVKEKTGRHGRRTKKIITEVGGPKTIVKEMESRNGLRSKTVVKEVGGPRTIIKETPNRTVVRQTRR